MYGQTSERYSESTLTDPFAEFGNMINTGNLSLFGLNQFLTEPTSEAEVAQARIVDASRQGYPSNLLTTRSQEIISSEAVGVTFYEELLLNNSTLDAIRWINVSQEYYGAGNTEIPYLIGPDPNYGAFGFSAGPNPCNAPQVAFDALTELPADDTTMNAANFSLPINVGLPMSTRAVEEATPFCKKLTIGTTQTTEASNRRRMSEALFGCPYCGATFTARHNQKYHLNSHLGRKPYKCEKGCSYAASSPTTARRHEKSCKREQGIPTP